jgi:sterol desaturase/sphingolipid hydroxylase (fatty acid hydroxylase superfamily)
MASDSESTRADKHWLVRPHNIRRLIYISLAVLAVVALLDFAIHPHAAFGVDGTPFFYSWYGFVTCVGMVVFAKLLGIFLKRQDSYYDD